MSAPVVRRDGAGRRRRHQMRDDRRRQLAPRPRAARRRLQPRRDAGAGRGGARARPPGDVPRARRARLDIAIEAGVNSIEHGCYLDEDPRHLERMAERGIFFVPTLLVYEYHRRSPQPHVSERADDLQEQHVAAIRRALDAGVKVVAGTDAGGHGHPANAGELDCLVRAGHDADAGDRRPPPAGPPNAVGRGGELGTVEKGKLADLDRRQRRPACRYRRVARRRQNIALVHEGRRNGDRSALSIVQGQAGPPDDSENAARRSTPSRMHEVADQLGRAARGLARAGRAR